MDTVYIDIGIVTRQWPAAPLLDMFISFLVEISDITGIYFGPLKRFRDTFHSAYRNACQMHFNL